MVVEICRACASGNGPSETTHAPIAMVTEAMIANEKATMRAAPRLPTPSCPGLSRASTSSSTTETDVDARDKPGHDGESFRPDALISTDAPQLSASTASHNPT